MQRLSQHYREIAVTRTVGLPKCANRKILCMSDLHFPFARTETIKEILEQQQDADAVVLAGDIMDGLAYSSFGPERKVLVVHEYMQAFDLVKTISERFPKLYLISGNHDVRVAKGLGRAALTDEQIPILRPDLLARIANGEELNENADLVRLHRFRNVHYERYDAWYTQIGKTIFAHPHMFKGAYPGGTVIAVDDYFSKRLEPGSYDSVVIGHTHRVYCGIVNSRLLIEQGAMCARQPYEHKPTLKFPHSMNGYSVIYQDRAGNTDFNKSRPYYVGCELPPKKGHHLV